MIAKVIPAKSGGRGFGTLVAYVTAEQRLERPAGREFDDLVRYVGREESFDRETGEVSAKAVAIETQGIGSLDTAAAEMTAVAAQCKRVRAPADYHLVLSWQEQERPTFEQAFAAGRHALKALGMDEHQYVMAVHHDTGNVHLHVAVNRVHPETYRAVSPFRDYVQLDRAMREVELVQGWAHDRGPTMVREMDGREPEVVLAFKEQSHGHGLDEPAQVRQKARDFSAWSGERPFTEWVRDVASDLKVALTKEGVTWDNVQSVLASRNLELQPKGSGLIVVDRDDPTLVAKASQIARFASRERLEAVLGPFPTREPECERTLSFAESGRERFRDYVRGDVAVALRATLRGREPSWNDVETTLERYGLGFRQKGKGFEVFDRADPSQRLRTSELGSWASPRELKAAIGIAYDATAARERGERYLGNPDLALKQLTSNRSTFTERNLDDWIDANTVDLAQARALKNVITESDRFVTLGVDERGRTRYTDREMFEIERRMVAFAGALAQEHDRGVDRSLVAGILERSALNAEQQRAVEHVAGDERFAAVAGFAGTGKSTLLVSAREAWEAEGYHVRGFTLSGIAAEQLERGSGIASQTVAGALLGWQDAATHELLRKPDEPQRFVGAVRDPLTSRDVLVVDEAGMVGSRQMERLLEYAYAAQAKVVLVGDREQLQSIAAGGAFAALTERFGAADVETVVRQHERWQREATRALGRTQTREALLAYERAGHLHEHRSTDLAKLALLAHWDRQRAAAPGQSQIILAYTRDDVLDLNERARAVRREHGELGCDVLVQTERGERQFAIGDRMYFLKNDRDLGVKNGTLGTIGAVTPESLSVRVDGKGVVDVDLERYSEIDYGYAATLHKAQGVTVDHAYVLMSPYLDRHGTYVGLSRHREFVDAFWSREDFVTRGELERVLSRSAARDTTLNYSPPDGTPPLDFERRDVPERAAAAWARVAEPREQREVHWDRPAARDAEPRESYRRDPDLRAHRRDERSEARERLLAEFRVERGMNDEHRALWDQQRVSERERSHAISEEKRLSRAELQESGVAANVASSLVAMTAAQRRDELQETIAREREALRAAAQEQRAATWREFVTERATVGDEAAISALRGLRYREQRRERDLEPAPRDVVHELRHNELRGPEQARQHDPLVRELKDLDYTVARNGDVAYHWKFDRREAFRDTGDRVRMHDTSNDSLDAALKIAREKWGTKITVQGSVEFKERALERAVGLGLHVANTELQNRQRQLIVEREHSWEKKLAHEHEIQQERAMRAPELLRDHDIGWGR